MNGNVNIGCTNPWAPVEKIMKSTRKIVEIDEELCDGCGACASKCAEGAIDIVDGKARLVGDVLCDGLGACLGECPRGAIRVIEREAPEFDPEAVEHHLQAKKPEQTQAQPTLACGCPSSHILMFKPLPAGNTKPGPGVPSASALGHWPVQIRLVPAGAPFLKGADLLIVSDCVPVAYPDFHRDLLPGKAVLLGCPKFDNAQEYIRKFEEIFRIADIRSVTVADMDVPCCSALPAMVKKAMAAAGKEIPFEEIVVSARGGITRKNGAAA